MQEIVLIGAGGHCKSCIDVIESTNKFEIKGILDRNKKIGDSLFDYPILGSDEELHLLPYRHFVISIGQIKNVVPRKTSYKKIKKIDGFCPIIISSKSYVSKYAQIAEGTIVMHNAFVNAASQIGKNCIINTKANIEHDVVIGNHCHISTSATINGNSRVGNCCFIGSSSVVSSQVNITSNVILGAGSVVVKDIDVAGVYVGSPVRKVASC
ncbi:acetyltransferase [Candidatus Uabimicrobium sp. HlEnr_7]|uniref:acetyltransferase n=1 Tax=Candidatus Uabimicrobium helgolandensis TaxID=3095367 RepID=UPI0035582B75